ncbi:MAG: cell wall-binding repeat-containing protein, partial [Actinomycetota bacterium]|nr:cell wall-binding repeat-containing protein [Actinomycetota bacterium]
GLGWNRVAVATGTNFPDALAGGVLQGKVGSVMLLTRPTALDPYTRAALVANKADITTVTFFGGTGALPQPVRDAVADALD